MNAHGGINGKQINLQTFDYAYEVPRAIAQYKKWKQEGMVAPQGWGTADTEALSVLSPMTRSPTSPPPTRGI